MYGPRSGHGTSPSCRTHVSKPSPLGTHASPGSEHTPLAVPLHASANVLHAGSGCVEVDSCGSQPVSTIPSGAVVSDRTPASTSSAGTQLPSHPSGVPSDVTPPSEPHVAAPRLRLDGGPHVPTSGEQAHPQGSAPKLVGSEWPSKTSSGAPEGQPGAGASTLRDESRRGPIQAPGGKGAHCPLQPDYGPPSSPPSPASYMDSV